MTNKRFAINGIAKKSALAAILAGAVLLGASTHIQNTRQDKTPQQTELMSQKAAEALKVNSLQQNPTVPTVHNPKLDATLIKFAESTEELNSFNNLLSNIYTGNGTYLGSILLQKEIDIQMLYALITKNTNVVVKNNINPQLGRKIESFGEAFYKTITPNAEIIDKWLDGYTQIINNNLQFDHKPTADEVSDRLDYIVESNNDFFTREEIIQYHLYCNDFLNNHIKGKKDIQAVSDMLAFKMFMIDKLSFAKELYGTGVFGVGSYDNIRTHYSDWMESVAPKGE